MMANCSKQHSLPSKGMQKPERDPGNEKWSTDQVIEENGQPGVHLREVA